MKNRLWFISLLILFIPSVKAQDSLTVVTDSVRYWKNKLTFSVNVNQSSFSSNWTGGGVNSIGLNSLFHYQANYSKGKNSWDNTIDLAYGFVNNEGQGFRKTVDRIFIDTKYGYKLNEQWGLFTSLNLLTQFAKGYKYEPDDTGVEQSFLISDAFAPLFVTSSWGAEYHPKDYFKVRISPFAPRLTYVQDPGRFVAAIGPEPYGVTPPDETRFEWLAFQLLSEFDKDIAPNLNLKWRYVMFANYETLRWETIDHRLDLNLTAKVNKFITVGLGGILIYDYDQVDEVQLSQVLTLGFFYSVQNYKEKE